MAEHNIWRVYEAVAAAVPERDAVVWRGRTWSFAELADRSRRLAAVLRGLGLGAHQERADTPGWQAHQDLVGLYLLNGREYLEGTLGGYAARTAPCNVNYRYTAAELRYLLDDSAAGALIFHERFAPTLAEVLPTLAKQPALLQVADGSGHGLLDGALDYEAALAAADPTSVDDLEPATDDLYVLYTGGTTGMPKGTLWTQADLYVQALAGSSDDLEALAASAAAASGDDRFLVNAPLMHGAAHWLALRALLTGGTVVVNNVVERLDPVDVWTLIASERCNSTLFVGEAFARPLLDELERAAAAGTPYDTSSLAIAVTGGATMTPATKDRLLAALPSCFVLDAAGASETGTALSSISAKGSTAEAGVFRPGPNARITDVDRTRFLDPSDPTEGWFATTGRVPLGYLGDQAKSEATFPTIEGLRCSVPGDRASWRPDGTVQLLGRESVTINTAGEKVFAEEVEQALLRHPAVADVTVVGRASERWGQEVVAVVALAAGHEDVEDADLVVAAAEVIARYKLPKAIVRVPQVVRSPAGKADYRWAGEIAVRDGA